MQDFNLSTKDKTLEELIKEYQDIKKTLRETFDFITEYSDILNNKKHKKMEIYNETKKK